MVQSCLAGPCLGFSRVDIQSIFGFAFMLLALAWTWFAFVAPARFGRMNALRYVRAVYQFLMLGGAQRFEALSGQIQWSSKSIIKHASGQARRAPRKWGEDQRRLPRTAGFAREVLGLLPHRPFCRFLVAESPTTAIALLHDAADAKLYSLEIGHFAHQISNAAIEDRASLLYHEAEMFTGIIGRLQSFKKALFGCHELIEWSGHSSLDLDHRFARRMTGDQVTYYGECVLTTFDDYIKHNGPYSRSSCLNRALEELSSFTGDLYTLDQQKVYPSEPYEKTSAVMKTLREMIRKLDKAEDNAWLDVSLRPRDRFHDETIFNLICEHAV